MTVGGEMLLKKFGGTALRVAEAFLRGELDKMDEQDMGAVVTPLILEAAKFRIKEGFDKK